MKPIKHREDCGCPLVAGKCPDCQDFADLPGGNAARDCAEYYAAVRRAKRDEDLSMRVHD